MKRIIFIAAALLGVLPAFSQELLDNSSFEDYTTSTFMSIHSADFEAWSFGNAWGKDVDTTDVLDGKAAFRTTMELKKSAILYQSIDCADYVTGDTFRIRVCYKNLNDSVLRLCSYWSASAGSEAITQDTGLHRDLPYSAQWDTMEVMTAKPEGARCFEFRLEMKAKSMVLVDDLSFQFIEPIVPYFVVIPEKNYSFTAPINRDTLVATIAIRQYNLTQPVLLELSGAGKGAYSIDKTQVTKVEDTVRVTFHADSVGKYNAVLNITDDESPATSLMNRTIAFTATAIDPTKAPMITITPQTFDTFRCKAYESVRDTLIVRSENCYDYVHVVVDDETGSGWAFGLSSSFFQPNRIDTVVITFAPIKAGTFTARYKAYTTGMDTLFFTTIGVAEEGQPKPVVVDYDTTFVWHNDRAYTVMRETFDMGEILRNKTLQVTDWQNVVRQGTRAWWGFNSDTTQQAKMTSYVYQADSGSVPFETWLVTPALDYHGAQTQLFSFKVMSDILFKGQTGKLEVYYIDATDTSDVWFEHIQSIDTLIPANDNELTGIWKPIYVDITDQPIADVFYMVFKFTDMGGNNGLTYYVDEVT